MSMQMMSILVGLLGASLTMFGLSRGRGKTAISIDERLATFGTAERPMSLEDRELALPFSEREMFAHVQAHIHLSRLRREHLAWNAATRTLTVTLPPLEISGPQVDLSQVQEYSEGGILMALTDAERTLDQANRRRALEELMRQARDGTPTSQARNAAMRIVARSFALPLRAAGIEASVNVRFVDPAGREEASALDRPNRIEDAVRNRL